MQLKEFTELYNRIQEDPSILLLGQNYLLLNGEADSVWQFLSQEQHPELFLPETKANYPQLWEAVVNSPSDAEDLMQSIHVAALKAPKSKAISAVMSLRWSLIYTSAIDGAQADHSDKGYTNVAYGEKYPQAKYLNKEKQYRVNLCGDIENPLPDLKQRIQKKLFEKQITDKISWISKPYLEYFGVLVIDGLDTEHDWLNDDNLFRELILLPPNSVYWFSAPVTLQENAVDLVERGILVTEEGSFYQHLLQHIPEMFETEDSQEQYDLDDALYTSLTLRLSNKHNRTVRISRSDITRITGDNLCVIDDEAINGIIQDDSQRAKRFGEFLMQEGTPSWLLFNARKAENAFYFKRDLDDELETKVFTALKHSETRRTPIIVEGPSNSGKSMMLANLAITIARRRRFPVIFIRGDLLPYADKRLDQFIDNWFCDSERYGGDRPDKTVVIWDGSGLDREEKDYIRLQRLLFNRNALVIGSLYSTYSAHLPAASSPSKRKKTPDPSEPIRLRQALSKAEQVRLEAVVASVGSVYRDRFREIKNHRMRNSVFENRTLLYLLQALFKYEFDSEFKQLSKLLAHQFQTEKNQVESNTRASLEEYVDTFVESQARRAQFGIASSFQYKLQMLLDQMAVQDRERKKEALSSEEKMKRQKLLKFQELSEKIVEINSVLAVASEFGVKLPLHLLLNLLRDADGHSYAPIREETYKIIGVLKMDTLIEFEHRNNPERGESYFVSFRNSIEAENYITLLCSLPLENHSKSRKDKEVELLFRIIELADTEEEIWAVIELARQFGPNGHGMLSELSKVKSHCDYTEYSEYWYDIANEIIQKFSAEPEAVLVYAHLMREYISRQADEHLTFFEPDRDKTRILLETALKKLETRGEQNRAQYDRLSVELCANYQQSLRRNFDFVIYSKIKERIRKAFSRRRIRESYDSRRDFSSNYLLDILLNAYKTYSQQAMGSKMNDTELTDIICAIDEMLNIDDLMYDTRNQDIIQKIKEVYEQLGKDDLLKKLQDTLDRKNSDIYLFLQARMYWQRPFDDALPAEQAKRAEMNNDTLHFEKMIISDRYTIVCRDIPYNRTPIPEYVKEQAQKDADTVCKFLERNMDKIKSTKSARCVEMLMRAKWYAKTRDTMLSEKQMVALTRDEWNRWNQLCDLYIAFDFNNLNDPFIPVYFLKGVYEWIYGDIKKSKENFQFAKDYSMRDGSARSVERLVLCVEGKTTPRSFYLQLKRKDNRKYTASIREETTNAEPGSSDRVASRYGMGVSEVVAKYLFNGMQPQEDNQKSAKVGEVRFNLIGAQIGIPKSNEG